MKTKYEVCEELKNQGVHAEVDGILWLYGISMRNAMKLLKSLDYDSTFGVRPLKEGDNSE